MFGTSFFVDTNSITISDDGHRVDFLDIDILSKSLKDRGLIHPIIINKQSQVVAGRRRLMAARSLGWEKIEVRLYEGTSDIEQKTIELEENIKRQNLSFTEECRAVEQLHALFSADNDEWGTEQTAEYIGVAPNFVLRRLQISEELKKPNSPVHKASNFSEAYNATKKTIRKQADDITRSILGDNQEEKEALPRRVFCQSFHEWAPGYTGKKFTTVHCDFPYGIDFQDTAYTISDHRYDDSFAVYEALLNTLLENWDNFASPVSHLIFWFSMKHYTYTHKRLSKKFFVEEVPLVWKKDIGIAPDPSRRPRRVYETAFLCSYGDAKLITMKENAFVASAQVSNRTHISQKNAAMLQHFLSMIVDSSSHVLDPTCGSGTALFAAQQLGATVFGLDIDPKHVESAEALLCQSIQL